MMLINNQEYLLYDKNMSKHQEKINKKGKSIIYMVQCKSSKDQIYIGKTHQESLQDRIDQHKEAAKKGSTTKFHNALLDYGLVNWEWIILATCPIEEEIEREKELIKKFNALPIDLLNTVHAKKNKSKDHQIRKELEPNLKGNKFYKIKKLLLWFLAILPNNKVLI